jgi:SAM-dependent MidA family methyltransferase
MPLPIPDNIAKAISTTLQQRIRHTIQAEHGWISFSDYMRMALYTPGLGYYSAGSIKLGLQGDFTTAPEITPLFGMTLANTIAPVLMQTKGDILEFGAGSGRLAVSIMQALAQQHTLPGRYAILEVSADLRERQQAYIRQHVPHLYPQFVWYDTLPNNFNGVMLGNEVLDAMPCHLIYQQHGTLFERGVSMNTEADFIFQDQPLTNPALQAALSHLILPNGYLTEIQLEAQGFIHSLAQSLHQGIILLIDYGFEEEEYYHPQRCNGTLMCHYRHHMHTDPFFYPGLQDITTHINFTALNKTAEHAGLHLAGYATQAQYLLAAGLFDRVTTAQNDASWYPISQAIQLLTSPAEMGDIFKVIAFSKPISFVLPGFD